MFWRPPGFAVDFVVRTCKRRTFASDAYGVRLLNGSICFKGGATPAPTDTFLTDQIASAMASISQRLPLPGRVFTAKQDLAGLLMKYSA